ncbi:MAG TPA: tetratricopeptide repeat protein [Polyangia bacterium]|nr:tetratricopeptide repeat protein [Polyangia bacterium]
MKASGERDGQRKLAALAELARGSARSPTSEELDGGLRAVRARIDAGTARRRAVVGWSLAAGVAMVAVVAVGIIRSGRVGNHGTSPAIAYRVEGGSLVDGGYLRESGHDGVKLLFAEGTEFALMPGTRSRLRTVDAAGARIAIEHGKASFKVTPSTDHRWQVDVGPFLVTVTGTVFTVAWDATTEKFELNLRHGRVTVSGPMTGGEIALRAGQRLTVDLPEGETVINEAKPEPPTEEPPAERPSGALDRSATRTPAPAPRAGAADGDRRWAQALAAGHLDGIIAEAERAGLKTTLEKASSEDLLALADAARYRRRMDLARDALLAERRRFPDSPHALDAAFLLGRVEEATDGGLARAVEWYDAYLTRAPKGTYASEALGRKMTLTSKLEGSSRARPVAEEYLRRFPNGTYAGPARAFVRSP